MKRRDLNAGDVFVYLDLPAEWDRSWIGTVMYVPSEYHTTPWLEGAIASGAGIRNDKATLDSPVVLLKKPAGRLEERAKIRAALRDQADALVALAEEI